MSLLLHKRKLFNLSIGPVVACGAFMLDIVMMYHYHYPLCYTTTSLLTFSLFYKEQPTISFSALFVLCFWQIAFSAPLGGLMFIGICHLLVMTTRVYLYTAQAVPLLSSLFLTLFEIGLLRFLQGHWPFPLRYPYLAQSTLFTCMALLLIFMLYYTYGKQGNRKRG